MTLRLTSLFEQALFIKQSELGSTTDLLPSLIAILTHFGVIGTFYWQGLHIFFQVIDKDTEQYWAKQKISLGVY